MCATSARSGTRFTPSILFLLQATTTQHHKSQLLSMLKPWIVPYCIFRCLPETLATSPSLYLSISRPPENHNPRNQTTGFSNLKKEWLKAKRFRLNTILTQSGMPIWIWVFADSYTPLPPAFLRAYSSSVHQLRVGLQLLLVQE